MSEYRQTQWTDGNGREYGVALSDGFDAWVDRKRMPLMSAPCSRTFNAHRISRSRHMRYVRDAVAVARAEHRPAVVLAPVVRVTEPNSTRTAPQPHDALTAIEAHVLTLDAARRAWEHVAASEPNRDGRGTVDSAGHGIAVNGTEVRGMPRWTASKRSAITTTTTNERGERVTVPVDWRCYRVLADGTRQPLVSTATAAKRKRGRPTKADQAARLRAIAGTLGVEAQG